MELDMFVWGDNWFIENNFVWFIDAERNMLLRLERKSNICEFLAEIPDENVNTFRLNPRCIKYNNTIFCIPDLGNSIWSFDLKILNFQQIKIENEKKVRVCIRDFWVVDDSMFAISEGLKKILEINMKENIIENYYTICDRDDIQTARSIKIEMMVYCVSYDTNQIFGFDLNTKERFVYTIPKVKGGFMTIEFDGHKFWLSGKRKEIYIWDKDNNNTEVLINFPKEFGIYDYSGEKERILDCKTVKYDLPAFIDSKVVGQYIWFIPFQTNRVLYIDKDTHQIHILDIKNEEETRESLSANYMYMAQKYVVEYVMDNRYIGLYSFKNKCLLEIDAIEKKAEKKNYSLGYEYLKRIVGLKRTIFYEHATFDRMFFKSYLLTEEKEINSDIEATDERTENINKNCKFLVGKRIHIMIKNSK